MLNEEKSHRKRGNIHIYKKQKVGGQLRSIITAVGTEPFALGFRRQVNTIEMKPFDDTDATVTQNHRSIRRLEMSTENEQSFLERFAYLRA
jgi:hypothetical protein